MSIGERDHLGVADAAQVSDDEREQAVRDLTRHCGDGRLTLDELEERVAEAYAATTRAELDHALRQLPRPGAPPRETVIPNAVATAIDRRRSHHPRHEHLDLRESKPVHGAEVALKAHLWVYLSVMALLTLIWFLTSAPGYFWPIWPAMGWGTGVAIHAGITKAVTTGRRELS